MPADYCLAAALTFNKTLFQKINYGGIIDGSLRRSKLNLLWNVEAIVNLLLT